MLPKYAYVKFNTFQSQLINLKEKNRRTGGGGCGEHYLCEVRQMP